MRRRLWAHLALLAAGAVAVLWALTVMANPVITCREVVLHPGDVCRNAAGTKVQTYEERLKAAQDARPVVGGVGLLVAGFGAALAAAEWRAPRRS